MARTAHTKLERETALELYRQHGGGEAARRTGINPATIRQWAKRSGVTVTRAASARAGTEAARLTWAQRKAELTVTSGELAAELLAKIREASARNSRDLAATYAIVVDRAQLLSGEATQRIEATDQFNHEIGRLLGEFDRRDQPQPPA
ncbi:MAG: hypothetical protein M3Z06_14505 [Actinomycetota bacterium]|nr:hypothetical protein [Actinomycetota bacterium]